MSPNVSSGKEVYVDYASFSPVDEDVLLAMLPYYGASYGNPSSLHLYGRRAKKELDIARNRIAAVLSTKKEEIIFTSSGTEANNVALLGVAHAYKSRGNHIIVSSIEHPSILEAAKQLQAEGFEISFAPVLKNGMLDVDTCMSLVTEKTILVSVMYVNNEIGTIQPIKELSKRLQSLPELSRPLFHTDACQAGNTLSLSPVLLSVDLMTINSTKIGGPSGVALLYKKEGVKVSPLLFGGEQEGGLRAGTENIPLAIGFSLALARVQRYYKGEAARLRELREYFIEGLRKRIPSLHIHGDEATQSPSIVHVTIPRIEGEAMLLLLDSKGIYASTGSACASLRIAPSHVLLAIGHDLDSIHGSIRFSFGRGTTKEELDYVLESFPVVTERLLSMTALKETTT